MSLPLTTSSELGLRKDLVRLRMEMHRQQILYHAQPLSNPLQQVKGLVAARASRGGGSAKRPAMMAATVILALFGRRLGKVGKLARVPWRSIR